MATEAADLWIELYDVRKAARKQVQRMLDKAELASA